LRAFAEWEEQEAILLALPHENTDWKPYLSEIMNAYVDLVSKISQFQKVILISPNLQDFEQNFSKFRNVEFIQIPTNDTWIRDYGAIDVENGNEILSLDFTFNAWGNKFESNLDNMVNKELFKHLNGQLKSVDMILEGGSVEFNGAGTLLTTKKCLLNDNRNANLSQNEIESRLKEIFGLNKIIWLENGEILGDDTDSHIDTLARFIDENTIAYSICEDAQDPNFAPLKAMEEELKKLKFNLISLPIPSKIMFENRRLGATYANFIFINDALIVPIYNDKNDKIVLEKLRAAVNREIIPVDARVFIRQNGSLHCSSQNRFKRKSDESWHYIA